MSRPRDLGRRFAAGTGISALRGLRRRVELPEDAVPENAALEAALEPHVAHLEQVLLRVVEARSRGKGHTPPTGG